MVQKETVKAVAIYGGIGGAVLLGGYGIYKALTTVASGPAGAGIKGCQAQWTAAFQAYNAQYAAYIRQNGGKPLTVQQEQSLQQYVSIMNQAENCIASISNASTTAWKSILTDTALAAVAGATIYASFRAYLNSRGGLLTDGTEARAAARNSTVQDMANNGEITADDAAANVEATQSELSSVEAPAEEEAVGSAASDVIATAEAEGASDIVVEAQVFVTEIVDTVQEVLYAVYAYFVDLFA